MAAAASAVVAAELARPTPPEGRDVPPTSLGARDGAVHLAGSGAWLPLARALVAAYQAENPGGPAPVVHGSIGSSGGLRAVADGVVDLGLIASASGSPPERACCRAIAVARAAVAVVVHPSVQVRALSSQDLVEIFRGTRTRWPDGQAVVPLEREQGDSATEAACRAVAGLRAALAERTALQGPRARRRVLPTDDEMTAALQATPGSVGLHDIGPITLEGRPLRAVAIDGALPGVESLRAGRYRATRMLFLVERRSPSPSTAAFVAFVRSPAGQAVIERGGYLALEGTSR